MSDERRRAAESQPETAAAKPEPKPDPRINRLEASRPVGQDGKPIELAEGWEVGEPTRLPIRGDRYVEMRPQPLVHELAYLSKVADQKDGDAADGWLREIAVFITGWSFMHIAGPLKGKPIAMPLYDPYDVDAVKRGKAIDKRVEVLGFITTDDLFKIQMAMRWLRDEVRVRYLDPPIAPSPDSEQSSESPSA